MAYCDYTFYTQNYHGSMSEADFAREVVKASAYIDLITMNRINESVLARFGEKIKLATCAVCDVSLEETEGGMLASQTVGSWSKTYADAGKKTTEQKKMDSAERYLLMTGLMYRGAVI